MRYNAKKMTSNILYLITTGRFPREGDSLSASRRKNNSPKSSMDIKSYFSW